MFLACCCVIHLWTVASLEVNATQCLCVPCFQVKRCCQRFMKKNTTLVLWWGLGTRGTESKIRLVGDRSTTQCKPMCLAGFFFFKSSLLAPKKKKKKIPLCGGVSSEGCVHHFSAVFKCCTALLFVVLGWTAEPSSFWFCLLVDVFFSCFPGGC